MVGWMPTGTGTVVRVVPKLAASAGLVELQLGLVGWAAELQRGMLITLREPG